MSQNYHKIGIDDYHGLLKPADKYNKIRDMQLQNKRVLMIGDGLNDSPALKLADAAMAPGNALEIAFHNAEDFIFQKNLYDILESLKLSKKSIKFMKQNFILSFIYNIMVVPIAMFGLMICLQQLPWLFLL